MGQQNFGQILWKKMTIMWEGMKNSHTKHLRATPKMKGMKNKQALIFCH